AKLISQDVKQLHDSAWAQTFHFGPRSTADDVTMPGTNTGDDPQDIIDEAAITQITTSGTPPSAPAAPVGTKIYRTVTRTIKDTEWQHRFLFGPRWSKDDIEMPATATVSESGLLAAKATIAQVTNSSTPPSTPAAPTPGVKLAFVSTTPVKDNRYKHTFHYE